MQSQYLYNQGYNLGYGAGAGVTLFPQGSAVTTPAGCTHFGGNPSGFDIIADLIPEANQPDATEAGLNGDELSTFETTFDILLQPLPSDGFRYGWVNLSQAIRSNYTAFQVNNLAPCCIPISPGDSENQFVDNTNTTLPWNNNPVSDSFRANGNETTGHFMGMCNLISGEAHYTWYQFAYQHVPGDEEPMVLVTIPTSSGAVQATPSSNATLSAGPPTVLQSLPLTNPPSMRAFPAANWAQVIDNYTAFPETSWGADGGSILGQCSSFISTSNESSISVPEWYVSAGSLFLNPYAPSDQVEYTGSASWSVAAVQPGATVNSNGLRLTAADFTLGRAFAQGGVSKSWFPFQAKQSSEFNASTLLSPASFWILQDANNIDNSYGKYGSTFDYSWVTMAETARS
ncbi:hypothetical protein WJX73_003986 [Symbiochloris irregularis]|uniref:Uncharacterized protein n=1 Tax=Symbiochloris irregularis TaxID=706552 RepID=A0AAW1P2I1_9CHLO